METIQRTDSPPPFTPEEITARMRVLFRTMADFYRAEPWLRPELADHFVEVTIPDLGVREAVVMLLGDDLPPGFFLFDSLGDVDRLQRETDAHRRNLQATCPSVVTLTFEPPPSAKEAARVERDRLELAAPDAFPVVMRVERDFRRGPPEALDVVVASAIAVALTAFEPDAESWQRGEPVIRRVRIHVGEVAVSLRNGNVPAPVVHTNILSRLAELERAATHDPFQRIALEEELLRQFGRACELRGLPYWFPLAPRAMLDTVFRDHGVTLASLGEPAFRETLFETIPEADVIDASQAPSFVLALEVFLHFMKLAHGLPQADELLRVLGAEASERLESRIRAVAPGWVPHLPHPVDLAPPPARTDRAARRARDRRR
jgi:hypothetical protein